MITIRDLAKSCGVSIATVSRAFSENGKINPKTKEYILETAKALDYVPNTIARSLKENHTYMVGLIIPDINNPFYISVIQKMEAAYREKGYHFVIGFYQPDISEEKDIIEDLAKLRVAAVIFSPVDRSSEEMIKHRFGKKNILQLFSSAYPEYDSLLIDDIFGSELATEYLISKGHKKILYYGERSRSVGYLSAMQKAGLDTQGLYFPQNFLNEADAAECIKNARPTAVLAVAKWAANVMSAIIKLKLNIPEDISLIVYDDPDWTKMFELSAISHPLDEIAQVSADILFSRITNGIKNPPVHKLIKPTLLEKNSVKKI